MYTRRDFGKMMLAGVPLSMISIPEIKSAFKGVRIGIQSYSFRTLSLDDALKAMAEIGIGECELFSGHIEPRPQMVERWEISADKLTYSFFLRPGLAWHDGQPVTAADCVASLSRWMKRRAHRRSTDTAWSAARCATGAWSSRAMGRCLRGCEGAAVG